MTLSSVVETGATATATGSARSGTSATVGPGADNTVAPQQQPVRQTPRQSWAGAFGAEPEPTAPFKQVGCPAKAAVPAIGIVNTSRIICSATA